MKGSGAHLAVVGDVATVEKSSLDVELFAKVTIFCSTLFLLVLFDLVFLSRQQSANLELFVSVCEMHWAIWLQMVWRKNTSYYSEMNFFILLYYYFRSIKVESATDCTECCVIVDVAIDKRTECVCIERGTDGSRQVRRGGVVGRQTDWRRSTWSHHRRSSSKRSSYSHHSWEGILCSLIFFFLVFSSTCLFLLLIAIACWSEKRSGVGSASRCKRRTTYFWYVY